MKTFYSGTDIETLASQGVRELIVDDDTVLTSVARELAGQLGVKLVTAGDRSAGQAPANLPAPAVSSAKPRGCQHAPLSGQASSSSRPANAPASAVVDDLIGAVKQLARQG